MAADAAEAADSHSLPRPLGAKRFPVPSPAVAYAVRFGVAVSAAIWLGKAPGLVGSHSTWILITVLMLVQPTTGASLLKAMLRAVGTLAAAFTAIGLYGLFAQDPPLLMAGFFLSQAIGAYGFSGPRFQYAWFVFAFTTAIILGDAIAGQLAVETVAFERASMVGIGIVLVFMVDALIWPTPAEPRLREALAGRARLLAATLGHSIAGSVDPQAGHPAASVAGSISLASQLGLVDQARSEIGSSRPKLDALARLALLLETLASRARGLATPIELPIGLDGEGPPLAAALRGLARRVEAALEEIAEAVTVSHVPSPFSNDLEHALLTLDGEWDRQIDRNSAFETRIADLRDLVALLGAIEAALSSSRRESIAGRSSRSLLSFRPDPYRMKIAQRSGIAVVTAFVVPMALGWPVNTLVAPVTFMVAVLTRGAAVQTVGALSAILALAWLVADILIIYVAPQLGRAPLALVACFLVAAAFASIAAKRPQLALLPSIGGVVTFLAVYGGTSEPTDVYGTYSTVCYLALALGIGWLSGRVLWPATAAGLFRERAATQLELCLEAMRGGGESRGSGRVQRAADVIKGIALQSEQLGLLHRHALLEPVERALEPTRRARILALATDLMDAVIGDRSAIDEASLAGHPEESLRELLQALKHERETLLKSVQASVDVMRGELPHRKFDLTELATARRVVDERMNALRTDPDSLAHLSAEETRRFLAKLESRGKLVFRQCAIEDWFRDWAQAETASEDR